MARIVGSMAVFAGVAQLASSAVAAQTGSDFETHSRGSATAARAVRAPAGEIKIDGVLDEAAWKSAPRFGQFTQQDPHEGQPGTETTEFQVVYTNQAIYVAVRASDRQPEKIAALLARRDDWTPADDISVIGDDRFVPRSPDRIRLYPQRGRGQAGRLPLR
jgi:hypothetical protein